MDKCKTLAFQLGDPRWMGDSIGWRTYCPAHNDAYTPNLDLRPGNKVDVLWTCRAGCSKEAIRDALIAKGLWPMKDDMPAAMPATNRPNIVHKKPSKDDWEPIVPVPKDAPPMRDEGQDWRFEFRDANGGLWGYVDRFNASGEGYDKKKKLPIPRTFCQHKVTGARSWRQVGFPHDRPVYGLTKLLANPTAKVLIVEGEKCADVAQVVLDQIQSVRYVAVASYGGTNAAHYTDWSPLAGREIVAWPDHDHAGDMYMRKVTEQLAKHGLKMRTLAIPADYPQKWDVADAIQKNQWTPEQVLAFIEVESAPTKKEAKDTDGETNPYFRLLGCDRTVYYFKRVNRPQLLTFNGHSMNQNDLKDLAPLRWWETKFAGTNSKCDWDSAIGWIKEQAQGMPVFKASKIRGKGAWIEGNHIVFHTGDRLFVDGVETPLGKWKSEYLYEADADSGLQLVKPLSDQEGDHLLEIFKSLNWEHTDGNCVNGYLLAGWVALAPFCGALKWRPHIWVTGAAGSGKTTVLRDLISGLVPNRFEADGASTAAGIRQELAGDARPIVYDEAEWTDSSRGRIADLMEMLIVSSSGTGNIVKGSGNQKAVATTVRSMFCLGSINSQTVGTAQARRLTKLELTKDESPEAQANWERRRTQLAAVSSWGMPLFSRMLHILPIVIHNVEIFVSAVAAVTGDKTKGDQIGPMVAGAFALKHRERVTLELAIRWAKTMNWTSHLTDNEQQDSPLLVRLFTSKLLVLRLPTSTLEMNAAEVIRVAISGASGTDGGLDSGTAQTYLMRYGMKADEVGAGVYIANNHAEIAKITRGTTWEKSWAGALRRLKGARPARTEFSGQAMNATWVPLPALFGDSESVEREASENA